MNGIKYFLIAVFLVGCGIESWKKDDEKDVKEKERNILLPSPEMIEKYKEEFRFDINSEDEACAFAKKKIEYRRERSRSNNTLTLLDCSLKENHLSLTVSYDEVEYFESFNVMEKSIVLSQQCTQYLTENDEIFEYFELIVFSIANSQPKELRI